MTEADKHRDSPSPKKSPKGIILYSERLKELQSSPVRLMPGPLDLDAAAAPSIKLSGVAEGTSQITIAPLALTPLKTASTGAIASSPQPSNSRQRKMTTDTANSISHPIKSSVRGKKKLQNDPAVNVAGSNALPANELEYSEVATRGRASKRKRSS